MQSFNFGLRNASVASAESYQQHSQVPSSIYSAGPAEEFPRSLAQYHHDSQQRFQEQQPRFNPLNEKHPRSSVLLNMNDPVAMHLLMETAIVDSKDYEILSFEEVDKLKRERTVLQHRIDAVQRKFALESKLRDAALSLNRLYSTNNRRTSTGDSNAESPKRHRRSFLGSRGSNTNSDVMNRADDEVAASNRKIEELNQEFLTLEKRLEETNRRLLEHNAGILQLTHKGLKKNIRKGELPRSPESMSSVNHRSIDGVDGFDERSLYQVPDYVYENGNGNGYNALRNGRQSQSQALALEAAEARLIDLSKRLHGLILSADPNERFQPPPSDLKDGSVTQPGARLQAQLGYIAVGLDAMESAQMRHAHQTQKSIFDSEDRLEDINAQLHSILERTNSGDPQSATVPEYSQDKSMHAQLAFSTMVLDRLNRRVERLVEQKDILTRQIQQQRELNSKSDSQRDAHIRDLTDQLAQTKEMHLAAEQDSQQSRNHITSLVEELDSAKQQIVLGEQQHDSKRDAHMRALADELTKTKEMHLTAQQECQSSRGRIAALLEEVDSAKQQIVRGEQDSETKRSAQTRDLTEELTKTKEMHLTAGQECQKLRDHIASLSAELDSAQQQILLAEQQHGMNLNNALLVEKEARWQAETGLCADLKSKQEQHTQLQVDFAKQKSESDSRSLQYNQMQSDFTKLKGELDSRSQQHTQLQSDFTKLKGESESRAQQHTQLQSDFTKLKSESESRSQQHTQVAYELAKARDDHRDETERRSAQIQKLEESIKNMTIAKEKASADTEKFRDEIATLESEVVRLQTDLTVVRAELDGAYGTRAQRAADVSSNPAIQKEFDGLRGQNSALQRQLDALQAQHVSVGSQGSELQAKATALQRELKDTIEDYEVMTKASIESEKERDQLEATVDAMRERCESLETQLSEEKVKKLGAQTGGSTETLSRMMLKNEFQKMMRDTRAENMKVLKAEQEERRRLETLVRSMKKEMLQQTPTKSNRNQPVVAEQ